MLGQHGIINKYSSLLHDQTAVYESVANKSIT